MKRILLVSICSSLVISTGCGDADVPNTGGDPDSGDPAGGDPAGGDSAGGGLKLGDACDTAADACDTGLICHDAGAGAVCHTACNPNEWPSAVCSNADEACGRSGASGACVASLAAGATCDAANDLCGAHAHCADTAGGTATVCVEACDSNADCSSTDACFILGFLTGGSETERVCDAALTQDAACDAAQTYCGAGLGCLDAGDGSGTICWLACDPDGDWSECDNNACVPEDYFAGTLEAAGGVCTPFVTDPDEPCDRYWDICANGTVCADIDGAGYRCEIACDYEVGTGCVLSTPACAPLDRVNPGSDPVAGVCIAELSIGDACLPDADLCPAGYECDGDLTLGWACRQRIGNGVGACLADAGQPCDLDAQGSCPTGDCSFGCPDTDGGTQQVHVSSDRGDDEYFCVASDNCTLAPEGANDCPPQRACVAIAAPGTTPGSVVLVRTCVNAAAGADGDPCDETARCEEGTACIGELDGAGTCRALCDSSGGTWPDHCSAQTGDGNGAACDQEGCCVDFSCFVSEAPAGVVGVMLPDFGLACDPKAQDCGASDTCLPQSGAWNRAYCELAPGTAGPGEPCQVDGTGPLGCAAGMLCLPFVGDTPVCVEACDPTAASVCSIGAWRTQANCIDVSDFGDLGPPNDTIGLCLPICRDDLADQCPDGESCIAAIDSTGLGFCMVDCDAGTDQAGPAATCEKGSVCIPDLVNSLDNMASLMAGTGTCDTTAWLGGATPCTPGTRVSDCGQYSQCIVSERLPDIDHDATADDGFCATYVGTGEVSCNAVSGARCPAGQACYSAPIGSETFCAEPFKPAWATPCLTTDTEPCGVDTCVKVAGGVHDTADDGYCFKPCDYDPTDFPNEGLESPTDNCELWESCYQVASGSEPGISSDGYCAYAPEVPGAPLLHCDDDHGLVNEQDTPLPPDFMCGRLGMALCAGLRAAGGAAGNHSPTVEPEGMCVARCLAGATGDRGTCFGNPDACAPDASLSGSCLSFATLEAPCDPLTQTGCAPFETCTTDLFPLPPGGYLSTCTDEVGLADEGEECDRHGGDLARTCLSGLMCQGDTTGTNRCFAPCDPLAANCRIGFTCVDVSRAFFGSNGELGLCMVDEACNLIAQDDCGNNETCQPVGVVGPRSSENHALQCVPTSGGLALGSPCPNNETGESCEATAYCATGLTNPLVSPEAPLGYCTRLCDPRTATGNSACPAAPTGGFGSSRACADVSAQLNAPPETYGICVK